MTAAMKYALSFISIISVARASHPADPGPWTAHAWQPGPDLKPGGLPGNGEVQANGGRFWIGKPASAYCPSGVSGLDCAGYPGGDAVFVGGNQACNGTLFLDVSGPGGQQGSSPPSFLLPLLGLPLHSLWVP